MQIQTHVYFLSLLALEQLLYLVCLRYSCQCLRHARFLTTLFWLCLATLQVVLLQSGQGPGLLVSQWDRNGRSGGQFCGSPIRKPQRKEQSVFKQRGGGESARFTNFKVQESNESCKLDHSTYTVYTTTSSLQITGIGTIIPKAGECAKITHPSTQWRCADVQHSRWLFKIRIENDKFTLMCHKL